MILAPGLGVPLAERPTGRNVPGWLSRFPFPGGPRLVLVLAGEAGVTTSSQLKDQLSGAVNQAPQQLVIDVSDVAFVDLSGLDVLYEAVREAVALGARVDVRGLSPLVWWLHGLVRGRQVPAG